MSGAASNPQPSQSGESLSLRPEELEALYQAGKHEALAQQFLSVLQALNQQRGRDIPALTPEIQQFISVFIDLLWQYMLKEDFRISVRVAQQFIGFNRLIANLTAVTAHGNSDRLLQQMMEQQAQAVKLLIFYSIRNRLRPDLRPLFTSMPKLAMHWCNAQFYGDNRIVTELEYEHLKTIAENYLMKPVGEGLDTNAYFHCSYLIPELEGPIRQRVNKAHQQYCQDIAIRNQPDRTHIAWIANHWKPGTMIHKCYAEVLQRLAETYRITLVNIVPPEAEDVLPENEQAMFEQEIRLSMYDYPAAVEQLKDNDFGMVINTSIGLNPVSILLANMRLAPIQVSCYGHPASSHGSLTDYFIASREVESPEAADYYSERLVLIPGLSVTLNQFPTKEQISRRGEAEEGPLMICCNWGHMKTQYHTLQFLKRIQERVSRPVKFRIVTGNFPQGFEHVPFRRELRELLGQGNFDLVTMLPYDKYIEAIGPCAINIDAFPFGGYQRVMDTLMLGMPTLALETVRPATRFCSTILRRLEMPELIAEDEEKLLDAAVRLIEDDGYRAQISVRLQEKDVRELVLGDENAGYFARAVDYLMKNHETLQKESNKKPVTL